MTYPNDRLYSADHEWMTIDEPIRVGITAFAAAALDEAVYVELPDLGVEVTAGEPCGEIESVKSVSDLVAPASGAVTEINDVVVDDPKLITDDPHTNWLYEVNATERGDLMDAEAYQLFIEEL